MRRWCLLAMGLVAFPAHAAEPPAPDRAACLTAFDEAQAQRREADLVDAKVSLAQCSHPACPAIIRDKCHSWLSEVERDLPRLVVVLPTGVTPDEVTVALDGRPFAELLEGRAVPIDPGSHRLEATVRGRTTTVSVVIAVGETRRVELQAPPDPQEPEPLSPPPTPEPVETTYPVWTWIGWGVAGAGAVVGTATGLLALDQASDLDARCPAGACPDDVVSDYDRGLALSHVSTVAFAVAGAGAVVGIVGLLLPESSPVEDVSAGPGWVALRGRF